MPDNVRQAERVAGLDSIRFVAASWVVLSHFAHWPWLDAARESDMPRFLSSLEGVLINGPAAVIVFFVISGFCIHLPYARGMPFDAGSFLVRRYVRIGLPLGAAMAVSPFVGLSLSLMDRMAIWSLLSEIIYYSGYPLLRHVLRRFSWRLVLGISFLLALLVVLRNIEHASHSLVNATWGDYPSFGIIGNAVLGLPCWLLGVQLAQWHGEPKQSSAWRGIGAWRLSVWLLSCLLLVLRFHSPLGYPWTLDLFAVAVFFWLRREIAQPTAPRPWRWLESAGAWSYSLYLVHPLAQPLFAQMAHQGNGSLLRWFTYMAGVYTASYLFYRLVEKPAHLLARNIGVLFAAPLHHWRRRP